MPYFHYSIIGIVVLTMLVNIALFFVVYKQNFKQEWQKKIKMGKFVIVFNALLTLIVSLIVVVLLIWSTILASYCDFSATMLSTSDFTSILSNINSGGTTDNKITTLLNECLGANGKGDLLSIINVPDVSKFQTLLNGF